MRFIIAAVLTFLGAWSVHADQILIEEGQTWTFKNAPHEDTRLVIGKIETLWTEDDPVVSVAIINLRSPRGLLIGETIHHLPFARSALVPHLIAPDEIASPLPFDFSGGYTTWKDAVETQGAGVFTISPAEAIEFVFTTVLEG